MSYYEAIMKRVEIKVNAMSEPLGIENEEGGMVEEIYAKHVKKEVEDLVPPLASKKRVYNFQPTKCQICEKTFTRPQLMRDHMNAIHYGKMEYKCKKCGFKNLYRTEVSRHIRLKHGVTGKGFMEVYSNNVLIREPSKEERDERKTCKICQRVFTRPSKLNLHMKSIHERKEKYKCRKCGKCCWYKGNLKQHLERQHGITEKAEIEVSYEFLSSESTKRPSKKVTNRTY